MSVNYTRINWEDSPSTQTPLNAENLNAMDSAIDELAGAVNDLDGVTDDIDDLESKVGAIKNDLTNIENLSPIDVFSEYYQGGITYAQQGRTLENLQLSTASNRIRSNSGTSSSDLALIPANKKITISPNNGYKFAYQVYDASLQTALDEFVFSTNSITIQKNIDILLVVMIGKTDDSAITPSDASNVNISYEESTLVKEINGMVSVDKAQSFSDAQKEQGRENLGILSYTPVTLPFEIGIAVEVYKTPDGYKTNLKPENFYINNTLGVVVFLSPDGNDTNDGLTVITPKKTLEGALGVTNVNTIIMLSGTYTSGVHFTAGAQVNQSINIIGVGEVAVDNVDGRTPIVFNQNCYIENVHFKHGNNSVIVVLGASGRCVFNKCVFSDANTLNGISIEGGKSYMFECVAHDNAYDGFNYHKNGTVINQAIEINCVAYNNGKYNLAGSEGQSSNASTTHDGNKIVRVNGDYSCCHGGIIADKEASAANYGCRAGVSTITDASYPDRMSNYWCSYGHSWLYDCISYGSKYDTAVVNGGVITSNVEYDSNYPS